MGTPCRTFHFFLFLMSSQTRKSLLVSGYVRICSLSLVPLDVLWIIYTFHGKEYVFFGTGDNSSGVFGLGHFNQITRFIKCNSIGNVCDSVNDISLPWGSIQIKTLLNQIYGCGKFVFGQCRDFHVQSNATLNVLSQIAPRQISRLVEREPSEYLALISSPANDESSP